MSFDYLHPKLQKALEEAGYLEPTPIQNKAIPKILKGFDIRASAQTGTGKTAAFLLPVLMRLTVPSAHGKKGPRALVLVPTRELGMQIADQAAKYSKYLRHIRTVCIGGGVPYPVQTRQLAKPYDLLIATPGRLIDFMKQGKITFPRLEVLVLDEADRMLDMGFTAPVEAIVAKTPPARQTLLFSATLDGVVGKLSEKLLNKPMDIVVHAKKEKHDHISQGLHYVDNLGHKNKLLSHILDDDEMNHAIVFTSTKRHANQLANELNEKGHKVAALHGDMNQRQRTRTITRLRHGKLKILIATDVAARGIDVQSISHVINFDLPRNVEDYVHRIGRTGRAGAKGTALSFAAGQDRPLVKKIEAFTGNKIDVVTVKGLEPKPFKAEKKERRRPSFRKGPRHNRNGRRKSRSF